MSNKIFNFILLLCISIIFADEGKKQPQIKGQQKGPFFVNVPSQNHHPQQGMRSAEPREVDSRKPIDEDKTIRQLIFPGRQPKNKIQKWCDLKFIPQKEQSGVAKETLQHTMGTLEYINKRTCVVGTTTTVLITFLQARPSMV
jgi:hypothetical protein